MAGIEQVRAIAERAEEMLATGEVAPPPFGDDPHRSPPYPWELTERRTDAPKRVWLATVDDFATGECLSVFFAASLARDEDEFRRHISFELGRQLAHRAEVRVGLSALPFSGLFLSAALRKTLGEFDRGERPPAAMSFFARYHANYA